MAITLNWFLLCDWTTGQLAAILLQNFQTLYLSNCQSCRHIIAHVDTYEQQKCAV